MDRITVNLENIADAIDAASDHWEQYLNVRTGEIIPLFDTGCANRSEEEAVLAEEILLSHHYVRLPGYGDVKELEIMQRFIDECKDPHHHERLSDALKRLTPGRVFRERIEALGLSEEYFTWRYEEVLTVARAWCEHHGIPFRNSAEGKTGWDEDSQEVV